MRTYYYFTILLTIALVLISNNSKAETRNGELQFQIEVTCTCIVNGVVTPIINQPCKTTCTKLQQSFIERVYE